MALFDPSSSHSTDNGGAEELLVRIDSSTQRKSRGYKNLQRTFSMPSPGLSSHSFRSSTCPSRPVSVRDSRSLRSISTPTRRASRSSRSMTSQSRINLLNKKQHKYSTLVQNSSFFDFRVRNKHPKSMTSRSFRQPHSVDQLLDASSNNVSNLSLTSQPMCHRVGRSISSPENLHPQLMQRANPNDSPFVSPTSPGRLSNTSQTHTNNLLSARSTHFSTNSCLHSPSTSFTGDTSTDRSVPNLRSFTPGISGSLDSSLYSSGQSIRAFDSESVNAFGFDGSSSHGCYLNSSSHTAESGFSMWHSDLSANLRIQPGTSEERPRLSQLALAHLTSRDLTAIHMHSPPPSYDKLCDPEALPTYQEALEGERKSLKKYSNSRRGVFTLPSVPNYTPTHMDPLIEDNDRNYNFGFISSLGGDLSDSEGGYTTILDAIPSHPVAETGPTVPIRFIPRWSCRRLKCRTLNSPCLSSLCNKALVKKEINRRWPFIVSVQEHERCPGLLLVECSSNLTVAQLPENDPRSPDGLMSGQFFPSSNDMLETPAPFRDEGHINRPENLVDIEEATALNNHVMFYLCGKCVGFDSFDAENVRTHLEYDCTGPANKWANISEMYLVMRAFCFILVIICILMWLPMNGW